MHSFLAKGRLLYTHDETIADSAHGCTTIGERDTQVQLLRAATQRAAGRSTRRTSGSSRAATSTTPRCGFSTPRRRWRRSRSSARGLLADREVIPQALKLNPAFFKTIYTDLLNAEEDAEERAGGAGRRRRATWPSARATLFAPVIDHLREVGEARSCQRDRGPLQAALRRRAA